MASPTNPFLRGADRPFQRIGHRGARGLAPENTLASFARAAELGASMVELDVQLAADGVPVVFHDHVLTRTTDAKVRFPGRAPWRLQDFSASELGGLDAGSWFVADPPRRGATREERRAFLDPASLAGFGAGRVRIPTLEEALACLDGHGLAVNLELKAIPSYPPGLVPAVVSQVRRLGLAHRVLFSSFDHQLVRELKRAHPDLAAAVISSERLADPVRYLVEVVGADALNPGGAGGADSLGLARQRHQGGDLASRRIGELRAAGLGVNVWTVNDPEDFAALREAGVDGIVTDFPNRLA